jgi:hypothetical protein
MIGAPDPGSQRIRTTPLSSSKGPLTLRMQVSTWQLWLSRLTFAYPWVRGLGPPAVLFVFSLVLRVPFVSNALVNWDAVQFALATRSFDIARHQPHPPGYILYIGWGRLLTWITGDANTAFVLTSLIAGSLAVAVLYLLGREMLGARTALLAAILFALSPLVWYYSIVALTYAVESLFLLVIAWLCWRAVAGGGERQALLASLVLGIAGGVRQSTLVLLIPLWLFATWTSGRRTFWLSWAVLGATCLAWFVPLVWLAGGPLEYLKDGLSLLGFVGGKTSVLSGGVSAVLNNLAQVGGGLLVGLNLGVILIGLAVARRASLRCRLGRKHAIVLALWSGPALGVFVLGHIGQIGYLLMILPAAFLVLALYVESAGRTIAPAIGVSAGRATVAIAGLLATAHIATVVMAPSTAHALLRDPIAASMVDVRDNDRFWTEVPTFLDRFTPQEAIVLAEASPWGSFRHAGYYLSGYRVYGLGNDRFGHFGWLFEAYGGLTDYSLEGRARRLMLRPTAARYAIVLDPKIVRTIVQEVPTVEVLATGYRSIWVVDLAGVDALTFEYGRTFLHGSGLQTRPDIPWSIRDLRVDGGN